MATVHKVNVRWDKRRNDHVCTAEALDVNGKVVGTGTVRVSNEQADEFDKFGPGSLRGLAHEMEKAATHKAIEDAKSAPT